MTIGGAAWLATLPRRDGGRSLHVCWAACRNRERARPGVTERRAARLGVIAALVVVVAQLGVGAAWSLTHDDLTESQLTRRCFEREKGLAVEPTSGDAVA